MSPTLVWAGGNVCPTNPASVAWRGQTFPPPGEQEMHENEREQEPRL